MRKIDTDSNTKLSIGFKTTMYNWIQFTSIFFIRKDTSINRLLFFVFLLIYFFNIFIMCTTRYDIFYEKFLSKLSLYQIVAISFLVILPRLFLSKIWKTDDQRRLTSSNSGNFILQKNLYLQAFKYIIRKMISFLTPAKNGQLNRFKFRPNRNFLAGPAPYRHFWVEV